MSVERHRLVSEIFTKATELVDGERTTFLDAACAGDRELRHEVERLLAADRSAPDLLDGSLCRAALESALTDDDRSLPASIGPYRVLGRLGAGAMGIVYEAETPHPRRRVAIKVLAQRDVHGARRARFEREAEALARLQHPGVARIQDANVAEDGSPYLVMELVRGRPLHEFLAQEACTPRDKLELFCRICDAVEAAHAAGIVHRDLKPQNIQVTRDDDGSARPKLLDFGVARLLGRDPESLSLQTEVGQLLGTLPYMSPEQLAGRSDAVDARTDVYALGVLLYEMLAGCPPLDVRDRPLPEATRILLEVDPPRLGRVAPRCRGDLETIAAAALGKRPADRYPSARALAADVRRHLADEPIHARAPSLWLQLGKLVRRHPSITAALGVAVVGLLVALGLVVAHASSLARAGARSAELVRILDRMLAIADFGPFDVGAWRRRAGPAATLGEALDQTAIEIDAELVSDPAIEVQIRWRVGSALVHAGRFREGRHHLDRALALAAAGSDADRLRIHAAIAWHDMFAGDVVAGAERGLGTLRDAERSGLAGADAWCSTAIATAWSLIMLQEGPRACELMARVLERAPEPALVARCWVETVQAQCELYEGLGTRAKRRLEALRDDLARIPGPHLVRAVAYHAMGLAAARRGARDEQIAHLLAGRAELERMVGPGENDLTDHWLLQYCTALVNLDRTEEAIRLLEAGVPRVRQRLGETNPRAVMLMTQLGALLAESQRAEEVRTLFLDWRDNGRTADFVPGLATLHHVEWADNLHAAGLVPLRDDLLAELGRRLQPWIRSPPIGSGFERETLTQAARLLLKTGDLPLARRCAEAAVEGWRRRGDMRRRTFTKALDVAALIRERLGDAAGAAHLRQELERIQREAELDIPLSPKDWGSSPAVPAVDLRKTDGR